MKYRPLITLLICFLSFFSSTLFPPAYAESVYKWVDAQGNIHYGDRPQGNATQTLRVVPAPPVDTASQQRLEALKKQDKNNTSKKEAEAKAERAPESNKEVAKRNCSVAKQNLAQLENSGLFLIEKDKDGTDRLMPPEERSKNTEAARKDIERWCNWT